MEVVWRAYAVEPQKEFVARDILERQGYHVEVPTESRLRRKNRYSKKRRMHKYPIVKGYVFVRLPANYHWPSLFRYRLIKSIVGFAGRPAKITDEDMVRLFQLSLHSLPHVSSTNTTASFSIGDAVEVAEGPFTGYCGMVEQVKGEAARMHFEFLGAKREIHIPLENLKAA